MPPPGMPSYPMGAPMWDAERTKQRDRTKTGVLLLLIGTLISWTPIGLLGSLLVLIGAILVILGRKVFGARHSRNVVISIVLVFLAIVVVIIGVILAFASAFSGAFGEAVLRAALNNILIVGAAAAIVGGLASVFFTFALQNQMGKVLLVAGYAASVVVAIIVFAIMAGVIPEFVASACPGGTCTGEAASRSARAFQAAASGWSLLNAIPSLLYSGAYYLVWNRINKGEIPAPPMPPGMPPAIQPR